ncbi:RluA family pseudouridine synthase [Runella sp.]|uniref:RluA family pseudouridine synthase n=1 Tax=Runella sp. TaxID=1960881 RepID=UPI003D0E4978
MTKEKPPLLLKVTETAELMAFLIAQLPHKNRNNIKTLLRDRHIVVEGRVQTQYNYSLQPNQRVEIHWTKGAKETSYKGLTILFEDAHLIVIEKQEGLLSIAANNHETQTAYNTLSAHVKKKHPANKIFIVHRLDRETSGVMVFAKSERVKNLLQESWEPTTKERIYIAVTENPFKEPKGTVTSYLHESKALIVYSSQNPQQGQIAITHYEVLKQNADFSLLKVELETGRKNQIRVHMQDLGHSIVGDKKYGAVTNPIGRLGLHAWVLAFVHPITNEKLRFETTIPKKFLELFS